MLQTSVQSLVRGGMTKIFGAGAAVVMSIAPVELASSSDIAPKPWQPQINLISSIKLQGSFVSPQAIYADSERIYAGSYQGYLFILERDRQAGFPIIQTIEFGSPLTAVRGDEDHLYVASRDGNLYVASKTWPIRFFHASSLSSYGLGALEVVGPDVYVAKGQAAMTASNQHLYLSAVNPGDAGIAVSSMQSYGEEFLPGRTLVFNRENLQLLGAIPNTDGGAVKVSAWQDFVFLTQPGCCGTGIDVYDSITLRHTQFINRSTNTVEGIRRKGASLLIGGSESGNVDLYARRLNGFEFINTVDLRTATGFSGSEDIEIRSLWVDGLDNLVIAGSSWGNDSSRSPNLPSLFILEIR